jgi:hypothetical protein
MFPYLVNRDDNITTILAASPDGPPAATIPDIENPSSALYSHIIRRVFDPLKNSMVAFRGREALAQADKPVVSSGSGIVLDAI